MLFNKSIFAVAIVALANVVTATQTPACVLKVIGNQPNPADSQTICGSSASKIQSAISSNCADSEASLKFFVDNCAQLGHKVATVVSTTRTSTATGTSESSTATGFVTAVSTGASATHTGSSATHTGGSTATGTGSSTGSSTSAGSTAAASGSGSAATPSPTFNAASSGRQFSATTFIAAVFLGAAALL
ncbi:uncharacterized protein N7479_003368 [Penicillium vulpinum]|uniref:Extracellular membrane protein CFEM domain-containing protein n=1 Tax=Penicillium vulpinum TaxID=29845 RepID=A0A1V6S4D6_9EURO|nr:uncharacterized protein N7479_003368 [Penicillium vulpinum]KAJ5963492.1 hypothetical protein N7479_003368 [Penicillium vulpinum]OQE08483.1 hypothetical protein PENVUL_c009G10285 [Penicillium vulpinum]